MSHSLRFLGLAVAAWVGVRAASLGVIPGAEALAFDRPPPPQAEAQASALPPIAATELTPPAPLAEPAPAQFYPPYPYPPYPPYQVAVAAYPAARTVPVRVPVVPAYLPMPNPPSLPYLSGPISPLDEWPLSRIAAGSGGGRGRPEPASSVPAAKTFDRLQLTAWAMMRSRPGGSSLASGGMLGGNQAGSRLTWRFDKRLAASLRMSAPIGGTARGGEVAAGLRYQPFAQIPLAVTAERRQGIGRYGGRSAFALFAEGGVWDRPVTAGFALDGYVQSGVVGLSSRDWFVDGSASLTRPLWRSLSAGAGLWGGAQPGLSRVDVGPRLSIRVKRSMRIHLDYRHKLAGNAQPGSGAVVTIAGDF